MSWTSAGAAAGARPHNVAELERRMTASVEAARAAAIAMALSRARREFIAARSAVRQSHEHLKNSITDIRTALISDPRVALEEELLILDRDIAAKDAAIARYIDLTSRWYATLSSRHETNRGVMDRSKRDPGLQAYGKLGATLEEAMKAGEIPIPKREEDPDWIPPVKTEADGAMEVEVEEKQDDGQAGEGGPLDVAVLPTGDAVVGSVEPMEPGTVDADPTAEEDDLRIIIEDDDDRPAAATVNGAVAALPAIGAAVNLPGPANAAGVLEVTVDTVQGGVGSNEMMALDQPSEALLSTLHAVAVSGTPLPVPEEDAEMEEKEEQQEPSQGLGSGLDFIF
ncbi:hypothetical protein HK101_002399 [Irineochytrium annulatum]|nr:hypothetical protein HK101_002399 [Irineochytrium annulatum]